LIFYRCYDNDAYQSKNRRFQFERILEGNNLNYSIAAERWAVDFRNDFRIRPCERYW